MTNRVNAIVLLMILRHLGVVLTKAEQVSEPNGAGGLSNCRLDYFAAPVAYQRANWPIPDNIGTLANSNVKHFCRVRISGREHDDKN
jgi:hypothetical protein